MIYGNYDKKTNLFPTPAKTAASTWVIHSKKKKFANKKLSKDKKKISIPPP